MVNKPYYSSLPLQQVSSKVKFEEDKDLTGCTKWMKDNMDALEVMGTNFLFYNKDTRKNYEIISGKFNIDDYIDNYEVYDLSTMIYQEMKLPSFLKHYDIISKAINLFVGEYTKRPDVLRVVAEDSDSTNQRIRVKTDLMKQYIQTSIQQEVMAKIMQLGLDPSKEDFASEEEAQQYQQVIQEKYKEFTPQAIEKYMKYDFRTAGESVGAILLENAISRLSLKEKDVLEFQDYMITNSCYSHIYITPKGYDIETWNPLHVFHPINSIINNTEDMPYVGRVFYISKNTVVDMFGSIMSKEQIEAMYPEYYGKVASGSVYNNAFTTSLYPFENYRAFSEIRESMFNGTQQEPVLYNQSPFSIFTGENSAYAFVQGDIVQVTQAYWKSQKKVGKLIIVNPETGEPETHLVDESFNPKLFKIEEFNGSIYESDEPNTITWTWIPEVWSGIKINTNHKVQTTTEDRNGIYINVKPLEFQFRANSIESLYDSKIPVIGGKFNVRNGNPQSPVDVLKPYQIMVNAFYNQAYHITQKNNGKIAIIGSSLLPNLKDWGGEEAMEKFMTVAANLGATVVNDDPTAVNSMQYSLKVLDLDESDRVQRNINLAMLVEQQGLMQVGITPQRMGSTSASETATGVQQSIAASFTVTETHFEKFASYRRRKLKMAIDLGMYLASKEKDLTLSYVLPDYGTAFLKAKGDDLLLSDLGVYMENTADMLQKRELVNQLILKNNQTLLPFSQLINVVRKDNLTDVQKELEAAEEKAMAQQQEQREHEQQMQEQQLQAQAEEKDKDRQLEKYKIDTQANVKLQEATIRAIGNEASFDPNKDYTDLLLQERDLNIKQNTANSNAINSQLVSAQKMLDSVNKRKADQDKLKQDKTLKELEIKSREKAEKLKIKAIEVQNKNQELLSREKHKNDQKLKDKDLQMKNLELKAKEKELRIKPKIKK